MFADHLDIRHVLAPEPTLTQTELVARAQITLPLYPALGEAKQDRVISAVPDGLSELAASPVDPPACT